MARSTALFATRLRLELAARNRAYARGHAHVESYGSAPVIVYAPQDGRHGNFFPPAYSAITANPEWMRRFDKVHAQAARSLPKPQLDPARRWRELDSSMSSDALLMNIFCTPGVADSAAMRRMLGVEEDVAPIFGWKARVPLANGRPGCTRVDRTEVDMRFGSLLVEAKLTEVGFQTRAAAIVESYRDFDAVFDRDLLPRVEIPTSRRTRASEFPENPSQEHESLLGYPEYFAPIDPAFRAPGDEWLCELPAHSQCTRRDATGQTQVLRPAGRAPSRPRRTVVLCDGCRTELGASHSPQGSYLAGTAALLPRALQDFSM